MGADGGVFTFGDAPFCTPLLVTAVGSVPLGYVPELTPDVGIAAAPGSSGYDFANSFGSGLSLPPPNEPCDPAVINEDYGNIELPGFVPPSAQISGIATSVMGARLWLVGIVGLVIVIVGAALVVEGLRRKFLKNLKTPEMRPRTRRVVELLGVIGTAARGLVFVLAGALVIDAAVTFTPAKAGGIDKALLTLRDQPFGEFLLILAALGLIIFGAYGLCEARWRKV